MTESEPVSHGLSTASDEAVERKLRASAAESKARAPLNAALATIVADSPDLRSLLTLAPAEQQLPVLLLAALHDLVLAHPDERLAQWYGSAVPNPLDPTDGALGAVLDAFVAKHRTSIERCVSTRSTQTNEVGRCALFVPAMAVIDRELSGAPLAHLDVGTSAGLNLGLGQFRYDYQPGGAVGSVDALVHLECGTRGSFAVPDRLPTVIARRGIDPSPLDLTDETDARWLRACVWPDQHDRLTRLDAAIAVWRRDPPAVMRGEAVDDVARHVTELASTGHPVITTSWVMNYLTAGQRRAFLAELDRLGETLDLSWIYAESPGLAAGLPVASDLVDQHLTALTLLRWRNGVRHEHHLAVAHPHGYWLHWRDQSTEDPAALLGPPPT